MYIKALFSLRRYALNKGETMKKIPVLVFAFLSLVMVNFGLAQITREEGTKSFARVLDGSTDDFTFKSAGEELLLVDIDGAFYQSSGAGEHEEELVGVPNPCDEGGPAKYCLQVLNSSGEIICWATKPRMPGWQRDPALGCVLPTTVMKEEYTLRVTLADEACGDTVYPFPDAAQINFYLLNFSLRKLAKEGSLEAAASSKKKKN
jgi:hypothetical protein